MINVVHLDKPLIFIGALYTFEFIKAVSDTVFDIINAVYLDTSSILSGLRFGRSLSPIIEQ